MDKKLALKDFDIVGLIKLKDVQGIERFVTPIMGEDGEVVEYLSRSKEYYNVKSMTELSDDREQLKKLLTRDLSRRNFVIVENMLNCSARVYFRKLKNYIEYGKKSEMKLQMKMAEQCLLEDTRNIICILQQSGLINLQQQNILPQGQENSEKRAIEMDNKAILYRFCEALPTFKNAEVLTPGYGAVYIGPFLSAIRGLDFTNVLKSRYIQDTSQIPTTLSFADRCSSDRPFEEGKIVILLDDNVGTGKTMMELKQELKANGVNDVLMGAIQFNWRNYYRVSVGDKKDIERFEPEDFDFITPINYAGHKLYKHAIDRLHSSGKEYLDYLKSKSYQKNDLSDFRGAIDRGILCARRCSLDLVPGYELRLISYSYPDKPIIEKYRERIPTITNPLALEMIERITETVDQEETLERIEDNRIL